MRKGHTKEDLEGIILLQLEKLTRLQDLLTQLREKNSILERTNEKFTKEIEELRQQKV